MTSELLRKDPALDDLDRARDARQDLADRLSEMAAAIEDAERSDRATSGLLGLDREIEDLKIASNNLREGVFRLLVLGDLKRGKSTFVNALLGERLLPSDVNPCTAILTVLRYGDRKQVTIHFQGDRPPEAIDFDTFREQYTIDPSEAKRLETEQVHAFPDVEYAVVEYPLSFLAKGIEIIDSPGLNDTEARNQLSLSYINNCQAILFVFRAVQPCTLDERRYLENYIKDRGLSVFFLINAWDEIRKSAIDPEDDEEVREAERKIRQVFRTHLTPYCQVDGYNLYEERVFEISSLTVLRRRLKDDRASLEGTGFLQFLSALNVFLAEERAVALFRQARTLARNARDRVREGVDRRLSLLASGTEELLQKLESVQPDFEELTQIRDRVQADIRQERDRQIEAISLSCRDYILDLADTFETDFARYQPDLGFLEYLQAGRRQDFERGMRQAFERYLNEKLAAWERDVEQTLAASFAQLAASASEYGTEYQNVINAINEKLTGQKIRYTTVAGEEDDSPAWAQWAMGFFTLATGNIGGLALAAVGFDWKDILVNWLGAIGITSFVAIFTGIFLGPLGIALVSLGIGALQAEQARLKFLQLAKREFTKALPQIAEQQRQSVAPAVRECFDRYEREIIERIERDIASRKTELDNLVEQKQSRQIDRDREQKRLQSLDTTVDSKCQAVEATYQRFLSSKR